MINSRSNSNLCKLKVRPLTYIHPYLLRHTTPENGENVKSVRVAPPHSEENCSLAQPLDMTLHIFLTCPTLRYDITVSITRLDDLLNCILLAFPGDVVGMEV